MGARGRPLRFIAAVLGGWTAMRVVALWPAAVPAPAPEERHAASLPQSVPSAASAGAATAPSRVPDAMTPATPSGGAADTVAPSGTAPQVTARAAPALEAVMAAPPQVSAPPAVGAAPLPSGTPPATGSAAALAGPAGRSPARLHGDAYLVARGGGGQASLAFGQLGASQAGARLTYALDGARRLALSARFAAPLHGTGREAAAGLDWRPTRAPIHLLVEDRYDLDARRHEPAAELIAGVYARGPLGLTLDAYAQGGAVAQRGPFADGAARLFRPVAVARGVRLEAGAGSWGGAQRGVARLDVGPSASLAIARGTAGLRLGVDYRLHVAGQAAPGSGPALTLGASF